MSSPTRGLEEEEIAPLSQPLQPTQSPGQDSSSSINNKPLTPNQEAARLRRERRNAKIQSSGSARLDAISQLSGRRGPGSGGDGEVKDVSSEKTSGTELAAGVAENEIPSQALDPDISVPANTTHQPSRAQQYQGEGGARPLNPNPSFNANPNPSTNSVNSSTAEPDPVLQAMHQMLAGQDPASTSATASNDPTSNPTTALLTALLGGGGTSFGAQQSGPAQPRRSQQQNQNQNQKTVLYWRLLHALLFFSLALHFVLYGYPSFSGTKSQRDIHHNNNNNNINNINSSPLPTADNDFNDINGNQQDQEPHHLPHSTPSPLNLNLNYWLIFLALELALQSGRFVLGGEEGATESGGGGAGTTASKVMATLISFLPPPWPGYLKVSSRYWYMFRTVRADILVFVFVLGVAGLLRA